MLERCRAREERLLAVALESERAGEPENTHFAMMARAENNRFIARLERDLEALEQVASKDEPSTSEAA
jgi:hypothetical protein